MTSCDSPKFHKVFTPSGVNRQGGGGFAMFGCRLGYFINRPLQLGMIELTRYTHGDRHIGMSQMRDINTFDGHNLVDVCQPISFD